MALEKVYEGIELDFDEIDSIDISGILPKINYKNGEHVRLGIGTQVLILDWWHKKRYEVIHKMHHNLAIDYGDLKESLDSAERRATNNFNLVREKTIKITEIEKENETLKKENEQNHELAWSIKKDRMLTVGFLTSKHDADAVCGSQMGGMEELSTAFTAMKKEKESLINSNIIRKNIQSLWEDSKIEAVNQKAAADYFQLECAKLSTENESLKKEIASLKLKSSEVEYVRVGCSLAGENPTKIFNYPLSQATIHRLHNEIEILRKENGGMKSGYWNLIEENLKLKAAKPAPSMYVNSPEDAKEIKRLKKKVNRLIVKKNMAENGWNVYGIYYRGKDYEEILQEIPKQNIWLKFNMEAMRAEYKDCWLTLKTIINWLKKCKYSSMEIINENGSEKFLLKSVSPTCDSMATATLAAFKPSDKFIKDSTI